MSSTRLPLSAAQSGVWLAHELDASRRRHNTGDYLVIDGPVDPAVFAAAWQVLAAEADVHRAGAVRSRDGLWLDVRDVAEPRHEFVDVSALADPDGEAVRRMREVLARPCDVGSDPLSGSLLFKAAEDRYLWFQWGHHVVHDGYSAGLCGRRLASVYSALIDGKPVGDSGFGTFADLLREEGQYRESPDWMSDREYWLSALADVPSPPRLGGTRLGEVADVAFLRSSGAIDAAGLGRLRTAARASGTLWTVWVTAAFGAYLNRMTGQDDMLLTVPVTGRTTRAALSTPGMMSNQVPLRFPVEPGAGVGAIVPEVTEAMRGGLRHQRYRYEDMCRDLGVTTGSLLAPMINIMPFGGDLSFGGHTARLRNLSHGLIEDLAVAIYPEGAGGGLRFDFSASPESYGQQDVDAHQRRFVRFLEEAAADPVRPIARIDLMLPGERHQVVEQWNDTERAERPVDVVAAVAAQVASRPEATAVVFQGRKVTYAELNARANRIAHHLIAEGAGPETFVALAIQPSVDLVAAVLAVLKTGAAYLPLDPVYPQSRIDAVLADARPVTVLREVPDLTGLPDTDPAVDAAPGNQAYMIYTSGSTGRPKGVVVPRSALSNFLAALGEMELVGPDDRVLSIARAAFDIATLELLLPLVSGAAVVVADVPTIADPDALIRLVLDERVTVMQATPSRWQSLLGTGSGWMAGLRVLTGGEELPAELAAALRSGAREVVNLYGPTETTIYCTGNRLERPIVVRPSVGGPFRDSRAYVLDDDLNPLPPGAVGEIYMAGACLSRGYHDRPGLTADRYLPDPFSAPGERMYRTGDRGRFLADGTLECLGRTDFQVKVRGHRVELGEIEANLTALPRVSHAVTLVRDGELVSYVVGQGPDPEALRARLADVLPAFMVPSAIVVLDALPLTANGKLDRAALPAPDRTALINSTRTARTPEERVLCDLFAEVLGLPEVGVDDAFFRLGGQSLLAVRLISRIRTVLGAELSVRDLYDAPTAAELALRLDRSAEPRPPLRRAELAEELPLSFAQRRLWFLNRLEGAGASYNITTSARISGLLDVPALRLALWDVIARHDSLRTVFPEVDGVPRQLVLDPVLDLATADVAEADLPARLREHGHRGFDLTTDLPFRVELFRVGGDHVLVTTMHHIAVDNGSITPLATDLITAYLARSSGRLPEWAEPAVRYADYTLWQRELLGDPADPNSRSARQLDHWRTALAGLPERIELPTDRRPSATPANQGGMVPVELDADLHRALAELADSAGVSLFMVLRAAFATVLSRAGAGDDVPIGTPNAGRTDEALDGVVGMFVNPLVLRTDLSGDPAFTELLSRVRDADLAAHANQDLPFEQIVDAVAASRSTAHHPLFQVMMPFRAADQTEWQVPGLAIDVAFVDLGVAQFDLQLSLGEKPSGGVSGHLEYSADLFEVDTAERIAAWFRHLLEAVAADPDRPLSALPMVGDGELAQVVGTWNETVRELPEQSLSDLIEAQVQRSPEAVAVIGDDVIWTYEELNARANQLARVLREDGVGLGSVVGVRMDRSPELVLAALAVLKAGGAYLPLDPALPAERLDFMSADAGARQVITRETVHSGRNRPASDLGLRAGLDAPAYVTYTSGTTGGPKGVLCTHRGVVNRVLWTTRAYLRYRPDDRVLVKVPIGFDVSVGEIFGPLVAGAGLVMARAGGEREPDHLRSMITEHGVTQAYFVPSMLSVMLAEGGFTGCRSLRLVLSGGEELSTDLASRVLAALPGCELVNQYGPTEAALDATAWRVSNPGALSRIPIAGIDGQIGMQDNVTLYVLDDDLRPAPAGVPGQLHIGGMGLAYGYLGRPGLTAARFVPDPFGSPGGRLYRTGDRVRWTPRRTLEYLGRTDQQVKINGARIELGEVQSALAAHQDVRQAVVTADGSRLLGYAVPVAGSHVDGEALREHLAVSLPEFMVPATIVVLEALPLTANGKVDLAALPAVDRAPVRQPGRSPVEDLLCVLYADVLGVPEVGPGDGFFALGGDSIMSIQLVSRARSHDLRFTPRDVFRHPTVAGLASVAESAEPAPVHTVGEAVGDVPHAPLSHALAVSGAPVDGFAQSVLVRVPAGLGRERLITAVRSVLDQHDMLRAQLVPSDEGWRLRVRDQGAVDADELVSVVGIDADIEAEAAAQVGRLAPAEGKMLRVTWFDAGPDSPGRLLIVAHHLVVDGVSWRILLPDLADAWRGGRPRPAVASTPFRVWSGKLAEAAQQHGIECPQWEAILAGTRASIATRPLTPADTGDTARRMRVTLPAAFRAGVEEVLLTALSLAVAKCRGGATVVDLEGHGREDDADLSRTVGWFTTVHPVRLDPEDADAARALKLVKEALRNVPSGGRSFGLLRHLNPETSGRLAALPQPEILFNYLGRFDGEAGADWEPVLGEAELVQGADVRAPLGHALTIDVHVRAGVLDATWTWAGNAVAEADVLALAESWLEALRTLAGQTGGGHVPSDFPLVSIEQEQLDALEAAHPNLDEVLPLTSLQSGLLYYSVLDGDVDVYNGRLWLELAGALDAGALRSATHLAVNRHAALRAAFVHDGLEAPVQVVRSEVVLPWEEADLSGLDLVEQEAETERLVLAQSRKFDLTKPPLLRFLLIRLDELRHRFVVVNHHLVMDGWSLPVLLEEIFAVYAGVELPRPARYTAHLDWLAGHDHDQHRKAWAGALAGLAEPTLVAPGARDEDMTMPRRLTTELSRAQTDELAALARAHSITTNTLIECAWGVLLSRLTGREDVVFGTTVSGRPPEIPGVERMIGMFVNTIPVRVRLGSDSVGELLARVQEEQARLTDHHHVGLDDIQRDAGLGPLFDTVTVLFNYPLDVTTLTRTEDLRVTDYWARDDTHFALRLAVLPGTMLRLNLDYRPDLFTEEEAQAHLDRVPTILFGFLADPAAAVATLDILTPAERRALLHSWSTGD
ncbi:non-ribosomal peptide synthetase [Amycolatopsis sp. YIM 10]|uniref:non-ribosomal peptide synthetase n=1 Tax=Amycolatopsis sp. YIM 10 TaxID=2653857 RepID=UPI00128FF167|nr:non-ribosomal peptide synthetase [Amycolatopsis sp. YIM 10]QFU91620.1 Dimodular nonribosomal peptide synthase [Amycolatopsis sp. YIM 10]